MKDNQDKDNKHGKEYKLPVRLTEEQLNILDYVANEYGLDKANTIRFLFIREYKKLIRDKGKSK